MRSVFEAINIVLIDSIQFVRGLIPLQKYVLEISIYATDEYANLIVIPIKLMNDLKLPNFEAEVQIEIKIEDRNKFPKVEHYGKALKRSRGE